MKEFKKNKALYIMPIIGIVLFTIASLLIVIYLHKNTLKIITLGVSLPIIFIIICIIYLIVLIKEPNVKIKIDENGIYIGEFKIEFNDIDRICTKRSSFGKYEPSILIVLKDNSYIVVSHINDSYQCLNDLKRLVKKYSGKKV